MRNASFVGFGLGVLSIWGSQELYKAPEISDNYKNKQETVFYLQSAKENLELARKKDTEKNLYKGPISSLDSLIVITEKEIAELRPKEKLKEYKSRRRKGDIVSGSGFGLLLVSLFGGMYSEIKKSRARHKKSKKRSS